MPDDLPVPAPAPAHERPAGAFGFLWTIGFGVAAIAFTIWALEHTGRLFWYIGLSGVIAIVVGLGRGFVTLIGLFVWKPLVGVGVTAALVLAGWGVGEILTRLDGMTPIAGRYTNAERGFSLEFPAGWVRKEREGFLIHALGPEPRTPGCRAELGVLPYHLKEGERTPSGFAQRVVRSLSENPGIRVHLPRAVTVGGREARELLYEDGKTVWLSTLVQDGERGFSVIGYACPAEADSLVDTYRQVASTFRLQPAAR